MSKDTPTVELRGKEWELQRLSYQDIYELIDSVERLQEKVAGAIDTDSFNLFKADKLPKPQQMKLLFLAVKNSKDEVDNILSMALGVDKEELADADKFPPVTPLLVAKALINEHPDIDRFKDEIKNTLGAMGLGEEMKKKYQEKTQGQKKAE